jgi:hypothetical protein
MGMLKGTANARIALAIPDSEETEEVTAGDVFAMKRTVEVEPNNGKKRVQFENVRSNDDARMNVDFITNPTVTKERHRFKYSSKVQEVVNETDLVNRLLDQPVTLRLGEVLATSQGLASGISEAVRRKKTPVSSVQSLNVEATSAGSGTTFEPTYLAGCPHVTVTFGSTSTRCTFDSGSNLSVVTYEVWEKSGM